MPTLECSMGDQFYIKIFKLTKANYELLMGLLKSTYEFEQLRELKKLFKKYPVVADTGEPIHATL